MVFLSMTIICLQVSTYIVVCSNVVSCIDTCSVSYWQIVRFSIVAVCCCSASYCRDLQLVRAIINAMMSSQARAAAQDMGLRIIIL